MKKFKNLWYTGVAIVGIPTTIILFCAFLVLLKTFKPKQLEVKENQEPIQIDTVIVEKRVVVRDTVYIKPKPNPKPASVKDTL